MARSDAVTDARSARAAVEAAEDELVAARDTYHVAIRQLAADGMSLRDIAAALGLSHQRVHQIVTGEAAAHPSRRRRRGGLAAGLIAALVIVLGSAVGLSNRNADVPTQTASDGPAHHDEPRIGPVPRLEPEPYDGPLPLPWDDAPACPGGPDARPDGCVPPSVIPLALNDR